MVVPGEASHRSPWTAWVPMLGGVLSVVAILAYAVVIALEIGAMRGQINLTTARVDALEQHGSGPVQQSAERVTQIQDRVDRILNELLDTQKRVNDIATAQARDEQKLEQILNK